MIIFVYPGETLLDKEKRFVGQAESELTDEAKANIKQVAMMLRSHSFDYVFSSDSKRCMDTADYIIKKGKSTPEMNIYPELRDRSYGLIEGKLFTEVQELIPPKRYKLWERDYFDAPPQGDSMLDIYHRINGVWSYIMELHNNNHHILVVADTTVIKVMIGRLGNMDESEVPNIVITSDCPYKWN